MYAEGVSPEQNGLDPREGGAGKSLRHVAELAGVSVATASRVMSGSNHPVNERTRERVLSAAAELSFEPNRLARALVTSKSHTVGVIVHDISDPYFGEIVKGLEDGIHADDYRLFVASSERDPERELNYVRTFDAYRVDGIVFAASSLRDPDYVETLRALATRFMARGGVIVVLSDHLFDTPHVRFDNYQAAADMVRYLAERGHRRIGFIGGPPEIEVSHIRLAGVTAALDELGFDMGSEYIVSGGFTIESGEAAMAELMEQADVTAVLAANDLMAIGAAHHLLSKGIKVPEEISVAGLDDIPMAAYAPVPLTTMRVPTYEIGQQGASLLLGALGGDEPEDVRLIGEIVERDSVATIGHRK